MFDLSLIVAAPMATAATPSAGCSGLQALNPLCYAVSAVGSIGGSVATAGIDAVLGGLSQWVASGAEWLLAQIGSVLTSTTTINLGASWFKTHYEVMTALAGVVILPLLLVSTLQAVYRQNAGQLIRAFFVQLPLALLLGVVAVQIVILCLSATDAMCAEVAGGSGSNVKALLAGTTKGLIVAVGDPTMATFVLLLVGLLVAAAAFVLWLELLVRAAAVYVAVLFLPLALATLVWPSVSHWCRRLVETLTALILSKFVIVATLSLAAGAVASGTAGTGSHGSGFASVLAGGALLVLSTFVPFSILRLIPMVEAGAVGHLEGVRQRSTAALTRVPRTAAQFAMREGMAAGMDAHGAAKLMARTGPPGTGGEAEPDSDDNGGLFIYNPDPEWLQEHLFGGPRDKGPKPLMKKPVFKDDRSSDGAAGAGPGGAPGGGSGGGSSGGSPQADDVPADWKLIGQPRPHEPRFYGGRDHMGGVIHGRPPLQPRPDNGPPGGSEPA
jgi:uncharacterized membrane protein YgcG